VSGVRGERGDGRGGSDDHGRRRDDGGVEDFEVEETYEAIGRAGAVPGNYDDQRFIDCVIRRPARDLGVHTQDRRDEEKTSGPPLSDDVGIQCEEEKRRWQRR